MRSPPPPLASRLLAALVPVAVGISLATVPKPAEACSPPMPECFRDFPFLADGETVPTNQEIRVTVRCSDAHVDDATLAPILRHAAGEALSGAWLRDGAGLVWDGELPADVTLELADTWDRTCLDEHFGWEDPEIPFCQQASDGEMRVLLTFTTGPGPDLDAPPPPEAPAWSCQEIIANDDPCEDELMDCMCCSCHPIAADWFVRTSVTPTGSEPIARTLVFWRRGDEAYDFDRPGASGPTRDQPLQSRVGDWHAVAVSVDAQGLMSEPSAEIALSFPDDCDFEQPFPGTGSRWDRHPLDGTAGGCGGSSVVQDGEGALALLLLGLLVAARSRGQRH